MEEIHKPVILPHVFNISFLSRILFALLLFLIQVLLPCKNVKTVITLRTVNCNSLLYSWRSFPHLLTVFKLFRHLYLYHGIFSILWRKHIAGKAYKNIPSLLSEDCFLLRYDYECCGRYVLHSNLSRFILLQWIWKHHIPSILRYSPIWLSCVTSDEQIAFIIATL